MEAVDHTFLVVPDCSWNPDEWGITGAWKGLCLFDSKERNHKYRNRFPKAGHDIGAPT